MPIVDSPVGDRSKITGYTCGITVQTRCLLYIIQYVPDLIRGEFVNIGIAVSNTEDPTQSVVRFTRDWSRVKWIDPEADIAMLKGLEDEWQNGLKHSSGFFDLLADSSAGCVQVTSAKASLVYDRSTTVDRLMETYVQIDQRQLGAFIPRSLLYLEMRSFLEHQGLWGEMDVLASRYAHPGNPLRIDCGYKKSNKFHCLHAVSILSGDDDASRLACSLPSLRTGVLSVEGLTLDLIAIVDSPDARWSSETLDHHYFNIETLTQAGILTVPVHDMSRVTSFVFSKVA